MKTIRGFSLGRLKWIIISLVILMGGASLHARPLDVGPIPELKYEAPEPQKEHLKNGVAVYMLPDHELPLFYLTLRLRVSPEFVSEKKTGVLDIFGQVWREGGTSNLSADDLNLALENMAAHVETSAGLENATVSLSCLSSDIDAAIKIWADVLRNPVFNNKYITLAKDATYESLRRKNETPPQIARRAFRDVLYGPEHVYARDATEASIRRIDRKDLSELHEKIAVPDGAIMSISGDFDPDHVLTLLEAELAGWGKTGRTLPAYDYTPDETKAGPVFFVEKEFTQSRVYAGSVGITRHDPDHFPLTILDYALGGGGASRLFAEIRSRLGLAYVVGSFFSEYEGPGIVGLGAQTRVETTLPLLAALVKELQKIQQNGLTADEISLAKNSILNSFVFRFDSNNKIVSEKASLEFYGYPEDYLETYPDKIKSVTPDLLKKVAGHYYNLEGMKFLVVGDSNKIVGNLEDFGNVETIPLKSID